MTVGGGGMTVGGGGMTVGGAGMTVGGGGMTVGGAGMTVDMTARPRWFRCGSVAPAKTGVYPTRLDSGWRRNDEKIAPSMTKKSHHLIGNVAPAAVGDCCWGRSGLGPVDVKIQAMTVRRFPLQSTASNDEKRLPSDDLPQRSRRNVGAGIGAPSVKSLDVNRP